MTTHDNTLVLLDVDGVLVHPVGYKSALRATVDHIADLMGWAPLGPTPDEIAVFEACGMTNEWSSGAVCAGALLLAALDHDPGLRRASLDETLAAIRAAKLTLNRPDFVAVARSIYQHDNHGHFPAAAYLNMLAEHTAAVNVPLLAVLLEDVYDVLGTPTTRIFQTYTLGDDRFAKTYGMPAPFASDSTLITQDVALLSAANCAQLIGWSNMAGHGAAIYTARPSLPPADVPAPVDTRPTAAFKTGYAPEAELATELLGVDGHLPLIGQGRVGWLAAQYGHRAAAYVKPSPVQALAAIGAALTGQETAALHAAAQVVEHGTLTGPLATLRDTSTRAVVFEDSVGGIRAVRDAVNRLAGMGLAVQCEAVGVSPHADKRVALRAVADHLVEDVNAGLARCVFDRV